jgi:hypothetical protein
MQNVTVDREAIREQLREQAQMAREAAREAQEAAQAQRETRIIVQEPPAPPAPPEAIVMVPPRHSDGIPEIPSSVQDVVLGFFMMITVCVVGIAMARAFGKRWEAQRTRVELPPETGEQLRRIEHAVEAMALEVERVSEAQRYLTKVQGEGVGALPPSGRSQ